MNIDSNSSNNISTTPTRPRLVSFYPHVKFKDCEYLGNGPYNKHYQVCDCCGEYKKIYILNKPVYYSKGTRRKFVSYCIGCYDNLMKGGRLTIADYKDYGYYEILDAIKKNSNSNSSNNKTTAKPISFEEAVKIAYNRTENISYNGSGAQPGAGVSNLKRYLGGRHVTDNNLSLNDKRLWEFRYKLLHEEPRVKVINGSDDNCTLLFTWNNDYVDDQQAVSEL